MIGALARPRAVLWVLLASVLSLACIAGFLRVAIHNEELAARQRDAERYEEASKTLRLRVERGIEGLREGLEAVPGENARRTFERLVHRGGVDSVIVQGAGFAQGYPTLSRVDDTPERPPLEEAGRMEFHSGDPAAAAVRYREAALAASDPEVRARAFLGQARCLARGDRDDEAREVLLGPLQDEALRTARDRGGDGIAASALMRAVELAPARSGAEARRLVELLRQDSDTGMSAGQRLFLCQRLRRLLPALPGIPDLQAERIALEVLGDAPPTGVTDGAVEAVRPGWWSLASRGGRVLGLLRDSTLRGLLADSLVREGEDWRLVAPQESSDGSAVFEVAAGESLPGWRLAAPLPEGRSPRERDLLLMGGLCLLAITVVAALMIRSIHVQARLSAWKNDLVSTVSHEMRTPLASVQALVETLLEGRCRDEQQRQEYLELIARENHRLGEMIEHFLSFARMEQDKGSFLGQPVDLAEVARMATEAARLRHPGRTLRLHTPAQVPAIRGEARALVTAVLNLIDNAVKYSARTQPIDVRLIADGHRVTVEVEDRGIGLSRVDAGRVFDRFYRANTSLARKQEGVGLGLSIVKFIVDAHQGQVHVSSQPGRGSRFAMEFSLADRGSVAAERGEATS